MGPVSDRDLLKMANHLIYTMIRWQKFTEGDLKRLAVRVPVGNKWESLWVSEVLDMLDDAIDDNLPERMSMQETEREYRDQLDEIPEID